MLGLSIVVFFGVVAAQRGLTVPAVWAAVLCAIHLYSLRYEPPRETGEDGQRRGEENPRSGLRHCDAIISDDIQRY
jgi:hypothetical protein